MPRSYAVDLGELLQKIDEMAAFETSIEQALQHLDHVVAGLHVTWTGEAADAHRVAHEKWVSGMKEMRTGLVEMREAARRAHDNYTHAVEANSRMWASVR
jgi:WXG100 family type VII secretion target